jgi:hypothetical protein
VSFRLSSRVNLICKSRHRWVTFLPLLGGLFVQPPHAILKVRLHASRPLIHDGLTLGSGPVAGIDTRACARAICAAPCSWVWNRRLEPDCWPRSPGYSCLEISSYHSWIPAPARGAATVALCARRLPLADPVRRDAVKQCIPPWRSPATTCSCSGCAGGAGLQLRHVGQQSLSREPIVQRAQARPRGLSVCGLRATGFLRQLLAAQLRHPVAGVRPRRFRTCSDQGAVTC